LFWGWLLESIDYVLDAEKDAVAVRKKESSNEIDQSIDLLIHQRTRILDVKLEVFAAEIEERIRIRRRNVEDLLYEELYAGSLLLEFHPNYGFRSYDSRLQQVLYQKVFDLTKERRQQDVDCWRDVVQVMRDFLNAWEAREQSGARARFLKNE
jgi:hypothetical protein